MRSDVLRKPEYVVASRVLHQQRLARFSGIPLTELRRLDWDELTELDAMLAAQDAVNSGIKRRNDIAARKKKPGEAFISLGHYPD